MGWFCVVGFRESVWLSVGVDVAPLGCVGVTVASCDVFGVVGDGGVAVVAVDLCHGVFGCFGCGGLRILSPRQLLGTITNRESSPVATKADGDAQRRVSPTNPDTDER